MATVNQSNGNFVQYNGTNYMIMMNQAVGIPNDATGTSVFGSSYNPGSIPAVTSLDWPIGPTLSPGACMLIDPNSTIYLFSWGAAFPLAGPPVLILYQLNGTEIPVPQNVVSLMPTGIIIQYPTQM